MNKTEKATPKKKRDERKKGNAFQSKDVISVVLLVAGFFLLSKLGGFIVYQIKGLYISLLGKMDGLYTLTIPAAMQILRESVVVLFITTVPIILFLAIVGIVMTGVQTGFLVSGELIKFKASRISIIQGFKRLLSLRSLVQLIKSLLKVIFIMWIIYTSIESILLVTPDILGMSIDNNISFMIDRTVSMAYKICLLFIIVAVLDYVYQKYDYEKKLRMTKQEVKEEYKMTEGDPFIKGKIKEKQRKMSMNRMIQQVPFADVIIRNPTHFAIALKYDIDKDPAPLVVAKGQDLIAKRILETAEENKVLITENKPLARGLYQAVDVNEYIPVEFYTAVAEVMAWVYGNKDHNSRNMIQK